MIVEVNLNAKPSYRLNSPLCVSAMNGHLDIVKYFVEEVEVDPKEKIKDC